MSEEDSCSSFGSLDPDSSSSSTEDEASSKHCEKVQLPQHIMSYLNNTILLRDEESIPCESKLAEEVMTNYIIAKRILSNICWQEKLLCKSVCTTWRSAVNSLVRENLNTVDFVYNMSQPKSCKAGAFVKSDEFYNEPLAVLTFVNTSALTTSQGCKRIYPCPCKPPCENSHCIVEAIQQQVCAPKDCMLSIVACGLTYLPLPNSPTEPYSPDNPMIPCSFFSGVSVPVIPGVKFHVLNMMQTKKNTNAMDLKKDFYDKIDVIAQDQIIKGALVFVTEKYILQSVQDIMMLNYLKQVQPDIPYALGGCLIEDTLYGRQETDSLIGVINSQEDFVSKNLISIALFTVPKSVDDSEHKEKSNFEMFSTVVISKEWTKDKIKSAIDEFAKAVPNFEHSLALKLSCVGRDKKHMLEQELFRNAFPNTPLLGCYGNGELGLNQPPREVRHLPPMKRHKVEGGRETLMYSYSTVFVYMGWGKIAMEQGTPKK